MRALPFALGAATITAVSIPKPKVTVAEMQVVIKLDDKSKAMIDALTELFSTNSTLAARLAQG